MHIGFDSKRFFFNHSGLGNYSRHTVELLVRHAPENTYTLFTPKPGGFPAPEGVEVCRPSAPASWFPSLWRSYGMHRDIRRRHIDIFHGLSNELPADIRRAHVKSVVTLHDLIFLQHPELYKPVDVKLYTAKYRRSCREADCIIAVSRATAEALTAYWQIPEERIRVVYQGCHPQFLHPVGNTDKQQVREKYHLPERYLLSVGTMEQRKNLLLIVKALHAGNLGPLHLVACGRPTPYLEQVRRYIEEHRLQDRVHLIHNVAFQDLPAIYQMSEVFIYPSYIEGFGIPIVEALSSHVPVITTRGGVFGETGGDACRYIDPDNPEELVQALQDILSDSNLRQDMIARGNAHIRQFSEPVIVQNLTRVYREVAGI